MEQSTYSGFDAAVVDSEDQAVALVQVKGHPFDPDSVAFLSIQLKKHVPKVDFVLTIDPNRIHVFRWNGSDLIGPIADLDTNHILQHYEPDIGKKRVFKFYLVTLAEAWLRDLAYHWKSETPSGSEELRKVGLLDKLEGGTTLSLGE